MFQTVQWISYTRLSCTSCGLAEVILILKDDSKVLDAPHTTIDATLVTAGKLNNQCGQAFYTYVLRYDDADLAPATTLLPSDIQTVICRGGLTKYIDEQVGPKIELEAPWNPASIADGASESEDFGVPGAEIGDVVTLGYTGDIEGMQISGFVSAANIVTVTLSNLSGAPKDVDGTIKIKVLQ